MKSAVMRQKQNGPHAKHAGRRWYCLGLTKRWSLYVASTATPGPGTTYAGRIDPNSPVVCGL